MEFLSSNLPLILCGLAGFGMLLAEAFMPGFGIAGIAGIILEVIAVYSAWIHHGTVFALILTAAILAVIALTIFFSYRSAMRGRLSRSALILKDEESAGPEPATEKLKTWKGKEGAAISALRPGGTIEVDGAKISAASANGEWVEKGTTVRIIGAEGDHVIVQPV